MYLIWRSDIRKYRNRIVELELRWKVGFPPLPNTCEPLRPKLPPILDYVLDPSTAPLLDMMWSASHYDLVSPAVISFLDDVGAAYEPCPAAIYDKKGFLVSSAYAAVQILRCERAVDWLASDVDVGTSKEGLPYVQRARRIVLARSIIEQNIPIFRLAEATDLILVSEQFRNQWEKRGLSGARFTHLEDYPTGWKGSGPIRGGTQ